MNPFAGLTLRGISPSERAGAWLEIEGRPVGAHRRLEKPSTLAALAGLKPNFTQSFGGVSGSMSSRWTLAHSRSSQSEWAAQAMASTPERPVTHSETPFLGRADKNFRETVSLRQSPPERSEPWVP